MSKNQNKYTWRNRHNPEDYSQWQTYQGPNNLQSPLYYYDVMIDEELLVYYTNIHAGQKNNIGNVTTSEMKCFRGILLYSGYVIVPRRCMYWDKSSDTDFSLIRNAMSRDRFNFIMSNIHCSDNTLIQVRNDEAMVP